MKLTKEQEALAERWQRGLQKAAGVMLVAAIVLFAVGSCTQWLFGV